MRNIIFLLLYPYWLKQYRQFRANKNATTKPYNNTEIQNQDIIIYAFSDAREAADKQGKALQNKLPESYKRSFSFGFEAVNQDIHLKEYWLWS